ncbi:CLUMA_CG010644, isoform A [Clunio marinus]|uniref:CLUMA_CG010644, isoform A n=1 Tax=Clunio marinus TaxID=568069 RepID=A0A1J1IAG3_9DIPT|nr:CLUMA_CG010644, isoform A [Clunio marinus]
MLSAIIAVKINRLAIMLAKYEVEALFVSKNCTICTDMLAFYGSTWNVIYTHSRCYKKHNNLLFIVLLIPLFTKALNSMHTFSLNTICIMIIPFVW